METLKDKSRQALAALHGLLMPRERRVSHEGCCTRLSLALTPDTAQPVRPLREQPDITNDRSSYQSRGLLPRNGRGPDTLFGRKSVRERAGEIEFHTSAQN